jgi:hypothetical protein
MPVQNLLQGTVDKSLSFKSEEEKRASIMSPLDITSGVIQERHIDQSLAVIKLGLAADRPDGTTSTKAYFATDTFVLSIWTGGAWKTVTLS